MLREVIALEKHSLYVSNGVIFTQIAGLVHDIIIESRVSMLNPIFVVPISTAFPFRVELKRSINFMHTIVAAHKHRLR